ncbi:hypothetical protein EDM60_26855 [Brevibacillus parabrevis]|nr:hypothetical protein EDM60_26855 [Brevibacillus parabrevis]
MLSNHAYSVLKEQAEKLYSRLLLQVMENAAFFVCAYLQKTMVCFFFQIQFKKRRAVMKVSVYLCAL